MSWWRAILAEPLVQLGLAGAALFAAYGALAPTPAHRIEVSQARIDSLQADWRRVHGAAATDAQLDALVREFVEEEALVREAVALGLDRGDPIVRRRLAQRVGFLLEDVATPADPGDAVLQRHLAAHPERFGQAARVAVVHAFFAADRHDDPPAAARAALPSLPDADDPPALGDAFPHGAALPSSTERDLAQMIGAPAAAAALAGPDHAWLGPFDSPFGAHLVRVVERRPPRLHELDSVRARVLSSWSADEAARRERELIDELVERYDVVGP